MAKAARADVRIKPLGESPDFLTARETALTLRTSLRTIYRRVAAAEIPSYRFGRSILFRRSDLLRLANGD